MMCRPERPSPDQGDSNYQVEPHFSKTPLLTPYPERGRFHTLALQVKSILLDICSEQGLWTGGQAGLFYAGSEHRTTIDISERPRTVLVVLELKKSDLKKWTDLDEDARKILAMCNTRMAPENVCLRSVRTLSSSRSACFRH
jgi:hypothetical protein